MSNFVTVMLMIGVVALCVMSVYKLLCALKDRKEAKRNKEKEKELSRVEQCPIDNGKEGK